MLCCGGVLCPTGFTGDFWRAYHEVIPKAPGFDKRKDLYLLYHYLNHTNLFGGGADSATRLQAAGVLACNAFNSRRSPSF